MRSNIDIDLEKACDRIPKSEMWRCLRDTRVSEKQVRLVQNVYKGVTSYVNSCVSTIEEFKIKFSLHQGSALIPYLFDLIMDIISEGVRLIDDILLTISCWCTRRKLG